MAFDPSRAAREGSIVKLLFGIIVGVLIVGSLLASSTGVVSGAPAAVSHASAELSKLAEEFRQFRSPVFGQRTWRPGRSVKQVPDYAAVAREQKEGLLPFQRRLAALSPKDWPVHDQVDYLLLRSEMDEVDFTHRVDRQIHRNPAFYVEVVINGMAAEMRSVVPYPVEKAEAIIGAFERTGLIVEQGPMNIILAEASADLARFGLRHLVDIRQKYAAGVKLMEPHFPSTHRARLVQASEKAGEALASYGRWIESHLSEMKGKAHIGRANLDWYYKRVNFVPWSLEELLFLGETEENRLLDVHRDHNLLAGSTPCQHSSSTHNELSARH